MVKRVSSVINTIPQYSGVRKKQHGSFRDQLQKAMEYKNFTISRHAAIRLVRRGVEIDETMKRTIEEGISIAMDKGIEKALIVSGNLRFVVDVREKNVITVVPSVGKNQVFTNIDGVVVMDQSGPPVREIDPRINF